MSLPNRTDDSSCNRGMVCSLLAGETLVFDATNWDVALESVLVHR